MIYFHASKYSAIFMENVRDSTPIRVRGYYWYITRRIIRPSRCYYHNNLLNRTLSFSILQVTLAEYRFLCRIDLVVGQNMFPIPLPLWYLLLHYLVHCLLILYKYLYGTVPLNNTSPNRFLGQRFNPLAMEDLNGYT